MNDTVTVAPVVVAPPAPLTKEQRIAKLREQITKLEAKITAIETGVEVKFGKGCLNQLYKPTPLPE